MKWEKIPLGSLCEIKGGKRLPKNHELIEQQTTHPYIRARDIGRGVINFSRPMYLQESTYNLISRYIVTENDIVLTIVGANIGDVGLIPQELDGANLTENAVKLTSFKKNCYFKFLLYFFLLPGKKKQLEQVAAGSAQGKLGLYKIKDIEVPIPTISTQHKIASILSAYDELIENNLKRIKLLEEKAFLKYKDIVQNNKLEKKKLKDILDLKYGKALKADDRKDGKYPVYGSSGAVGFHEEFFVSGPGIIVGRKGNIGSVFWSDESFWPIDTVYYVESNLSLYFLYFNLKEQHFVNTDAAVPGLNRNFTLDNWIYIPSERVLADFDLDAKPIFELKNILRNQNTRLRQARDLLLPRLMNGEISV
ncbi:restriction endonuclease subunit S [Taibaiella koreensis]|uniref:restriction endonuclease subunit S n=1 Tax=Taibaiella koreensis TaxID=1268548 RepID=UPI000E599ADB|nr:restriction endonuclease subunit S [Taibaiella koreensis]